MAITTNYKPYDYAKAYQEAERQQRAAEEATYNKLKSNIEYQQGNLGKDYDAQRSGIYTNSRVSAIGNNEVQAAKGLAGGLYNQPTTGYSESSRIKQNLGLQNALNAASAQEQQERNNLNQILIEAAYQRDANLANYLASAGIQRANAESAENQFLANYNFQAMQAAQQAEQYANEQAYNKAITELNTFGKIMTKESAKVLGMPIGTTSFAYQQSLNKSGRVAGTRTIDKKPFGGPEPGPDPEIEQASAPAAWIATKVSIMKDHRDDVTLTDSQKTEIEEYIARYIRRGELSADEATKLSKAFGWAVKYNET